MIRLSAAQAEAIREAAERSYPEECCGLLVGPADDADLCTVSRVLPSANAHEGDRRRGFEIEPRLLLEVHKAARGGRERLLGVYHSHPDGGAEPSATDLARAWDRDLCWIIAAVRDGRAGALAAFRPGEGRFEPMPLRIEEAEITDEDEA